MFKDGDRVKCVKEQRSQGLVEGDVYTVRLAWFEGGYFIKVKGLYPGFSQSRFVKVNLFKGNK